MNQPEWHPVLLEACQGRLRHLSFDTHEADIFSSTSKELVLYFITHQRRLRHGPWSTKFVSSGYSPHGQLWRVGWWHGRLDQAAALFWLLQMYQVRVDRGGRPVQGSPVAECPLRGEQEQWWGHNRAGRPAPMSGAGGQPMPPQWEAWVHNHWCRVSAPADPSGMSPRMGQLSRPGWDCSRDVPMLDRREWTAGRGDTERRHPS